MARAKKNGFDTTMLEKYADQLEQAGGSRVIKWAAGDALRATKMELNRQITKRMQPGNLPAGGKYSTGDTLKALNTQYRETWEGNMARMPLGFNMDGDGITSVFLMYGTPQHAPVPGLNDTIKGKVARKKIREDQEKAIQNILEYLGKAGK